MGLLIDCSTCITPLIMYTEKWPVCPSPRPAWLRVNVMTKRRRRRTRARRMRNDAVGLAARCKPMTSRKWKSKTNAIVHSSGSISSVCFHQAARWRNSRNSWHNSRCNQTWRAWSAVTFTRAWTATLPKNSFYIRWPYRRQRRRRAASKVVSAPINARFFEILLLPYVFFFFCTMNIASFQSICWLVDLKFF